MSIEKVKDPTTALFILKWLETNKQKFFKDIQLTDSQIVQIVEQYIEEHKDELKGDDSLPPDHRWIGTKLQFRDPDGNWGKAVDLKGPRSTGAIFGGGFNIDSLPICDTPATVTELVVKSDGVWKRLPVTIVVQEYCQFITADGEMLITVDGENFVVQCDGV